MRRFRRRPDQHLADYLINDVLFCVVASLAICLAVLVVIDQVWLATQR